MNNLIKEYITESMRKLTNRYVKEFKKDLEIDLNTLNETTIFPEHLIFIARTCGHIFYSEIRIVQILSSTTIRISMEHITSYLIQKRMYPIKKSIGKKHLNI